MDLSQFSTLIENVILGSRYQRNMPLVRIALFLILFWFFSEKVQAQYYGSEELDSLVRVCERYPNKDETKVDLLNKTSRQLSYYNPELGIEYARKAQTMAADIAYLAGQEFAKLNRIANQQKLDKIIGSNLNNNKEQRVKIISELEDVLKSFTSVGNYNGRVQANLDLANFYSRKRIAKEAEEYALEALELSKKLNFKVHMAHAYFELAMINFNIGGDTVKAKSFLNKAVGIFSADKATQALIQCYQVVGNYYDYNYDFDNARKYFLKAAAASKNTGYYFDYEQALYWIASNLDDLNQLKESFVFVQKALELSEKYNLVYQKAQCYHLFSNLYSHQSDYKRCIENFHLSLKYLKDKNWSLAERNYLGLSQAYRRIGNYEKAHATCDSAIIISRNLGNDDKVSTSLGVKGDIYYKQQNIVYAKKYLIESVILGEKDYKNSENLDRNYAALGNVYLTLGDLDSALYYTEKSLKRSEEIQDDVGVMYVHIMLAKIHRKRANFKRGLEYLNSALLYARAIENPNTQAFLYYEYAAHYRQQGNRMKSLVYADSAIEIWTKINNYKSHADALTLKGHVFSDIGAFANAIDVIQESLKITEKLGPVHMTEGKRTLAGLYYNMKDYRRSAEMYHQVASELKKSGNDMFYADACISGADAYMQLGDFTESVSLLNSANEIYAKHNDPAEMFPLYIKYAKLNLKTNKLTDANRYAQLALNIGRTNAEEFGSSELHIILAQIKMQENNVVAALEEINKAVTMSTESQKIDNTIEALKLESELFKRLGKYDSAYYSYMQYIRLRDSIFNVETKNEILRKELQFEFDKKEAVYKLNHELSEKELRSREQDLELSKRQVMLNRVQLEMKNKDFDLQHLEFLRTQAELNNQTIAAENRQKENDIKTARIALMGKQRELQQSRLSSKTSERNALVILAVLLLAISFVIFRNFVTQRNSNKIIAGKNQELSDTLANLKKTQKQLIEVEQQKRLAIEKSRIARDMHDELGAGLTKISILTELLRADANGHTKQIEEISQTASELVDNMSQIIWTMNPENDKLENLFGYIRKYGMDFFEDSGVICSVEIPENVQPMKISQSVRRNVFLVIKETLNNIIKHSGATKVNIRAEQTPEFISIAIADNGNGFELKQARTMGNGLNSIYRRLEEIGGSLEVKSESGKGTETVIRCECKEYDENPIANPAGDSIILPI